MPDPEIMMTRQRVKPPYPPYDTGCSKGGLYSFFAGGKEDDFPLRHLCKVHKINL